MKRCEVGLLVWLICLSIPVGALSVPYAHIHRDAAHTTDHHDGRQVHRHGPTDQHEHQDQSDDQQGQSDATALNATAGPASKLDVTRPAATTLTVLASIGGSVIPIQVAAPVRVPGSDWPPGDPPTQPSLLRGPPLF